MNSSMKIIIALLLGFVILSALMFSTSIRLTRENSSLKDSLHRISLQKNFFEEQNKIPNPPSTRLDLLAFQAEMLGKKYPLFNKVVKSIFDKSQQYDIDPNLIMSIVETESAFNPYAVSNSGAYGLMQVNYSVWKNELDIDHQRIFDISYNLDLGIRIIKHYLELAGNDLYKALFYYNNGFSLGNKNYPDKVVSTVFY